MKIAVGREKCCAHISSYDFLGIYQEPSMVSIYLMNHVERIVFLVYMERIASKGKEAPL